MKSQKKKSRKLALNRETVRELDDRALGEAKGAHVILTPVINTLPLQDCIVIQTGA